VREKRPSRRLLVIPAQSVVIYRLLPRASKRGISRFLTVFKATGLTLRQPASSETNRFCRCIQREVNDRPRLLYVENSLLKNDSRVEVGICGAGSSAASRRVVCSTVSKRERLRERRSFKSCRARISKPPIFATVRQDPMPLGPMRRRRIRCVATKNLP